MRSNTRPPLPDGTYYAADSAWRGWLNQTSSLIDWLKQLNIDECTVYQVDIGPTHATIYRFKHENGKPYVVFRHLARKAPLVVSYERGVYDRTEVQDDPRRIADRLEELEDTNERRR